MSCRVSIPLSVFEDPAFTSLRRAFHPETMGDLLGRLILNRQPKLSRTDLQELSLQGIRVFRHKFAKRCLVEYELGCSRPAATADPKYLVGKISVRGPDHRTLALLRQLWSHGFGKGSTDGILIPEPLGMIAPLHLLLQRKVAGEPLSKLLQAPTSLSLAHQVAEALVKLHRSEVSPDCRHTVQDELCAMRDRFHRLRPTKEAVATRVDAIYHASARLVAGFTEINPCLIHRDFQPAQILVDGNTLHLLDFDLSTLGDPALDLGHLLGHLTEQSLRQFGHAGAYSCFELMLKERYLELSGVELRPRIRAYQTLTLVKHLHLCAESTKMFPLLLDCCEERLGLRSRGAYKHGAMPSDRTSTTNESSASATGSDSYSIEIVSKV